MSGTKIALLVALACGLGLGVFWMEAGSAEAVDPFTLVADDRAVFEAGLVSSERAVLDDLEGASISMSRRTGDRSRVGRL